MQNVLPLSQLLVSNVGCNIRVDPIAFKDWQVLCYEHCRLSVVLAGILQAGEANPDLEHVFILSAQNSDPSWMEKTV